MKGRKFYYKILKLSVLVFAIWLLIHVFLYKNESKKQLVKKSRGLQMPTRVHRTDMFMQNFSIHEPVKFIESRICARTDFPYNNTFAISNIAEYKKIFFKTFNRCEPELDLNGKRLSIVKVEMFELKDTAIFHINPERFKLKLNESIENHECFLERYDYGYKPSIIFYEKFIFKKEKNYELTVTKPGFYHINCINTRPPRDITFRNVYNMPPSDMSSLVEKRNENIEKVNELKSKFKKIDNKNNPMLEDLAFDKCAPFEVPKNIDKMNIMILAFDSVSTNQFRRAFPLTYNYLTSLAGNVFFDNFHSVGENTYPNIISLLTGMVVHPNVDMNLTSEVQFYRDIDGLFHDTFPFVWLEYEKNGYLSAYQEDYGSVALLTYLKQGVRHHPTTYYMQPFWLKYSDFLGQKFCIDQYPMYREHLDQLKSFVRAMNNEKIQKHHIFYLIFISIICTILYICQNILIEN